MTRWVVVAVAVLAWAAWLEGCTGLVGCVDGTSERCTCDDGRAGARTCDSTGTFGVCACVDPPHADASMPTDSGVDAPPADLGVDAGADQGTDAGEDAALDAEADAGSDAETDAGSDAGVDAATDGTVDASATDLGPVDLGVDAITGTIVPLDGGGLSDAGSPIENVAPAGGPATAFAVDAVWVAWVWSDASGVYLDVVHTDGTGLARVATALPPATLGPLALGPCSRAASGACGAEELFWVSTDDPTTGLSVLHAVDLVVGETRDLPGTYPGVRRLSPSQNGDGVYVAYRPVGADSDIVRVDLTGAVTTVVHGVPALVDVYGPGLDRPMFTAREPRIGSGSGYGLAVYDGALAPTACILRTTSAVDPTGAPSGLVTGPRGRRFFTTWSSATRYEIDSAGDLGTGGDGMNHDGEAGGLGTILATDGTEVFFRLNTGRLGRIRPTLIAAALPITVTPTLFGAGANYIFWPIATGVQRWRVR